MNNHRFYFITFFLFFLTHLASTFECDEHFNQDDIPFNTKVHESPIIIIGTSLNKNIDPNIRNLFNVTLLVQCILKGRPTQRIIHVVQAGSLLGRRSCQRLNVNREYIVFLEPFFDGNYRPADFEEVPYSNQINVLLEKTCSLSRTYPFTEANDTDATLTNKCPSAVSIDCPIETSKTILTSSSTTTTINSVLTTTTSTKMFRKNTIDLAALSILLAENQQQNLSLAFLQDQNHKSLFSDDEERKNGANRLSIILITNLIFCSILHILF